MPSIQKTRWTCLSQKLFHVHLIIEYRQSPFVFYDFLSVQFLQLLLTVDLIQNSHRTIRHDVVTHIPFRHHENASILQRINQPIVLLLITLYGVHRHIPFCHRVMYQEIKAMGRNIALTDRKHRHIRLLGSRIKFIPYPEQGFQKNKPVQRAVKAIDIQNLFLKS